MSARPSDRLRPRSRECAVRARATRILYDRIASSPHVSYHITSTTLGSYTDGSTIILKHHFAPRVVVASLSFVSPPRPRASARLPPPRPSLCPLRRVRPSACRRTRSEAPALGTPSGPSPPSPPLPAPSPTVLNAGSAPPSPPLARARSNPHPSMATRLASSRPRKRPVRRGPRSVLCGVTIVRRPLARGRGSRLAP